MRRLKYALLLGLLAPAASADPSALDATSVAGGVAVTAVTGPVNGCAIIPGTTALIVNIVGTAGTSASGTSVLQPTNAPQGFQCGPLGPHVNVSVNCSGGGACSWTGYKY